MNKAILLNLNILVSSLSKATLQTFSLQSFLYFMFQLFSKLKKENTYVAVLGTSPANEYKSETCPGDLQTPLLRALRTDPFKGTPLCPYLEQPNVVTGLAAQSKYTERGMLKRNVEWYIKVFRTGVYSRV